MEKINKKYLELGIILAMVIIIMFFVYQSFMKEDIGLSALSNPRVEQIRKSNLGFEKAVKVLEKESFLELIKFGSWPVVVEEKGSPNPFLKIE